MVTEILDKQLLEFPDDLAAPGPFLLPERPEPAEIVRLHILGNLVEMTPEEARRKESAIFEHGLCPDKATALYQQGLMDIKALRHLGPDATGPSRFFIRIQALAEIKNRAYDTPVA